MSYEIGIAISELNKLKGLNSEQKKIVDKVIAILQKELSKDNKHGAAAAA